VFFVHRIEPDEQLDDLAATVVDASLAVHRALGPGFLESVYEEALAVELGSRGVPFERQVTAIVKYRGCRVGEGRIDMLIDRQLVVELKAVEALAQIHVAQVISYLKAFEHSLGLLINFNTTLLREGIRRVVLSRR
jgi:GxxExxY protein